MKFGPIVEESVEGGGYKASMTMTLEDDEVEAMGGVVAARVTIERNTEELVRALNARLEYMKQFKGGFRSDGDQGHHD